MHVTLVRFTKDDERRDFRLKSARCLVGRLETCDLPMPLSSVSREHCEFRADGGTLRVKDLGSRNGTFVNGERLAGEAELKAGDRVAIGPVVFTVQIDGVPEGIEPPLLESPASAPTPASRSASAGARASGADGEAEALSDLIAEMDSEDSSVFDLDMFLDDDEDKASA